MDALLAAPVAVLEQLVVAEKDPDELNALGGAWEGEDGGGRRAAFIE